MRPTLIHATSLPACILVHVLTLGGNLPNCAKKNNDNHSMSIIHHTQMDKIPNKKKVNYTPTPLLRMYIHDFLFHKNAKKIKWIILRRYLDFFVHTEGLARL